MRTLYIPNIYFDPKVHIAIKVRWKLNMYIALNVAKNVQFALSMLSTKSAYCIISGFWIKKVLCPRSVH